MTLETYSGFDREITIDLERDSLLTAFGLATIKDRYLWTGETSPQHMFARVACVNSDDNAHAQRMYNYISRLWFMGSTPVLSNSGHAKNLPISCFLNAAGDSMEEIAELWNENVWLASRGGGIGSSWSETRDIGRGVGGRGTTSGVIPFMKIQDSQTLGISQGNLRRGSAAVYLDVSHPEIEEFLDIRDTSGGDPNRKCLNLHHGVVIPDAFMQAVKDGTDWQLVSPHDGKVMEVIKARKLWEKILTRRLETGEPYLWFVDTVNRNTSPTYKANGLFSTQSNLCSEIALSTSIDYNNRRRTAVCCLSSLNLEKWDEWEGTAALVVEDCMRFLDNVMSEFIRKTDGLHGFERANYAARQERSIGLGVMGFHGLLQSKGVPFEGAMAKVWNKRIFSQLKTCSDNANLALAVERGSCPDALRAGILARFAHVWAIAPTASISIIAGESSPGIEPSSANVYKQKTLSGWYIVKNKYLDKLVRSKLQSLPSALTATETEFEETVTQFWNIIMQDNGSIQGASLGEFFTPLEKDIFKTAFELNQEWIIEHAADRQPNICQGQSVNVFLPATAHKKTINKLHQMAWEKGLKGLYYCRSKSIGSATNVGHTAGEMPTTSGDSGDSCLACQ